MAGFVADLMEDISIATASDLPVESPMMNQILLGVRDGLARMNDALHDKMRQIEDDIAQLKMLAPDGGVAEQIAIFEAGQTEFAKHQAEMKTKY